MKILAVSDHVEDHIYSEAITQDFGNVDLVLACGDLPFRYIEYIVSKLDVPLLYVFGNHDHPVHTADGQVKRAPAGGINTNGRVAETKGLLIGGLEGSMYYSTRASHQYTEWDMHLKVLSMTPALLWNRLHHGRFLDILITHAPPYRIHDGTDRCHTGFKAFLRLMEIFRPRYLIHGHQHVYTPETIIRTTYRRTEVVNCYGHQVIQWPPREEGEKRHPGKGQ